MARESDVRSGKKVWQFNTIPRRGGFGNDTWKENSWGYNGNTGVWTQISVDEDAGLVYLPVETPTSDFYGGDQPGANPASGSHVAGALGTGEAQRRAPKYPPPNSRSHPPPAPHLAHALRFA